MARSHRRCASCLFDAVDQTIDERDEQTFGALFERHFPALALAPDEARPEGEHQRQVGKRLLERFHDLAAPPPGLGRIFAPRSARGVALLLIIEELALVLLGIEQNAVTPLAMIAASLAFATTGP